MLEEHEYVVAPLSIVEFTALIQYCFEGEPSNQDQVLVANKLEYIVFCVREESWLVWSPVYTVVHAADLHKLIQILYVVLLRGRLLANVLHAVRCNFLVRENFARGESKTHFVEIMPGA